jgi:endonuclease-3
LKPNRELEQALDRLFTQYGTRKHPLAYENRFQLLVMVVLSSRSTDVAVNKLAPAFFAAFPSMAHLAQAKPEELFPHIRTIPGFVKKAVYLIGIAKAVGSDEKIPTTMEGLIALPGIGRKSANVILRESGSPPEGIIVDLHVLRVTPRIGLTKEEDAEKVERDLMTFIPRDRWHSAGMAFSFLGRELCRPTDPACGECVMAGVCVHAQREMKRMKP